MRKSIVLLITLFFITTISILILQNLKDTDRFLDNISSDSSLSQIQITIENVQSEIPKFFKKNEDNLEQILENSSAVPLSFGNVDLLLNIEEYEMPQFNINELNATVTSTSSFSNNINYQYDFLELVKANKPYSSRDQIEQTISEYIKKTKDKEILNIKDEFTYFSDKNVSKLIKCDYSIKVGDTSSEISFIFDLNSSVIKDFSLNLL